MKYLMDLAFFFEPPLAPLLPLLAVVDFFVTLVDVLAKEDVDLVVGGVALALAGASGAAGADFFVESTF